MNPTSSSKTILITGATGFIGSFLAAGFLRKGSSIIALSRDDATGARTSVAIRKALLQDPEYCDLDLSTRLRVLPVSLSQLRADHALDLRGVDEVWHCAAEMSFSTRKLESSFDSNICQTNGLYQLISDLSPGCRRFFYVSTAYTGGADSGMKKEILHTQPHLINPYQITKWGAEMSLSARVLQGSAVPVTLFRPAVVIGDTRSGYYPGSPFGLYMYLQAFNAAKNLGAKRLTLDLNLDSSLQLVPIEILIANAMALSDRATRIDGRSLEIVHATGQAVSNGVLLDVVKRVMNMEFDLGQPQSTVDIFTDMLCQWVKRFGNGDITFADTNMQTLLGAAYTPTELREKDWETLIVWYREHMRGEQLMKGHPTRSRQPAAMNFMDRFASRNMREKAAHRMLKRSV